MLITPDTGCLSGNFQGVDARRWRSTSKPSAPAAAASPSDRGNSRPYGMRTSASASVSSRRLTPRRSPPMTRKSGTVRSARSRGTAARSPVAHTTASPLLLRTPAAVSDVSACAVGSRSEAPADERAITPSAPRHSRGRTTRPSAPAA